MIRIVLAEESHIAPIVADVRAADRAELHATIALPVDECLRTAMQSNGWAFTALADDVPLCMFGCARGSILSGGGYPWMIGTNRLDRYAVSMIRHNRPMVRLMHQEYGHLYNYVHAANTRAVNWLQHLGFTIFPPEPYGVFREPFHKFEMR